MDHIGGAACSNDLGLDAHVGLGEGRDHIDPVRVGRRGRLMKKIIFLAALAFAVSAGVATVIITIPALPG